MTLTPEAALTASLSSGAVSGSAAGVVVWAGAPLLVDEALADEALADEAPVDPAEDAVAVAVAVAVALPDANVVVIPGGRDPFTHFSAKGKGPSARGPEKSYSAPYFHIK